MLFSNTILINASLFNIFQFNISLQQITTRKLQQLPIDDICVDRDDVREKRKHLFVSDDLVMTYTTSSVNRTGPLMEFTTALRDTTLCAGHV